MKLLILKYSQTKEWIMYLLLLLFLIKLNFDRASSDINLIDFSDHTKQLHIQTYQRGADAETLNQGCTSVVHIKVMIGISLSHH